MRWTAALWCAALVSAPGCLPEDTRKPPGRLDVTLTSDYPLDQAGFDTADGWRVDYDRFLVVLGEIDLRGDDCTPYNETDYLRVFDARSMAPQKVSTNYALGACDLRFRMRPPEGDAVLGEGVNAADLALLRQPGSDAVASATGNAVFVSGSARSGATVKRFAWDFRLGAQYDDCKLPTETGVHLAGDDEQTLDIAIRSQSFFQHVPNEPLAELRFAPFAEADDVHGDADGIVTLDELARVSLAAAAGFDRWESFADYLYTGLVPKLPRYRGSGTCTIGPIEEGGHGPGGGH